MAMAAEDLLRRLGLVEPGLLSAFLGSDADLALELAEELLLEPDGVLGRGGRGPAFAPCI